MGMRATVKKYSIIVRTRKKVKVRTKLEQEQIWNDFQGFPTLTLSECLDEQRSVADAVIKAR